MGNCEVTTETGSQVEDFMKMSLAPTLFCTGSSFCLWAGMSNIGGQVHFPIGDNKQWASGLAPNLGSSWHWRTEPRLPSDAIRDFRRMTPEQVVEWIRMN